MLLRSVSQHDTLITVIVSFRHTGLRALYESGSARGVRADHVPKLSRILSALDVATEPKDLDLPSFRLHALKGERQGSWAIWVNGNWWVTFRFLQGDVELVGYEDYH